LSIGAGARTFPRRVAGDLQAADLVADHADTKLRAVLVVTASPRRPQTRH